MRAPLVSSLTLVLLAACSNGEQSATPETTTGPDASQPANNEPKQGQGVPSADLQKPSNSTLAASDEQALGLLSAINQNEIAVAKEAQKRQLTPNVSDFATMMIKDHTENEDQIRQLGQPSDDAAVQAQKSKGEAELAELGKHEHDYAKAYVDAMVKGHNEALETIDTKLLPAAQSPAVKAHLQQTRTAVSHHLDAAKSLQASM